MKKINVFDLPLAANVCDQMLREVFRNPIWSIAYVIMNPKAESLLHHHKLMDEVYVITRGSGELIVGDRNIAVREGSVMRIQPPEIHKFTNTGVVSLEHLVLALPPFDPSDVLVEKTWLQKPPQQTYVMPNMQDCFDGAKIIPYEIFDLDLSIAVGWVMNDPTRHKKAHFHKQIIEYAYVVEGSGEIEINGQLEKIVPGDWIEILPGERHAFRNTNDRHMVIVCICSPRFNMDDVHYD